MASNIATNHKVPYAHYFFYRSASEDRASFAKLFKIGQNWSKFDNENELVHV